MKNQILMDKSNRRLRIAEPIRHLLIAATIGMVILLAGLVDVSFSQSMTPGQNAGAGYDSLSVAGILILFILGNAAAIFYIFYYFKRADVERLRELTIVIHQISDGNLHQSAPEKNDKYRDLSCAINDMSTNIQEVLIFLWKQNTQAVNLLSDIASKMQTTDIDGLNNVSELIRHCNEIEQNNADIRMLLRGFHFFGVNMNADGVWQNEL